MTVHFQTGSSAVRCGLPMRDAEHPDGWDLGTVTVDPSSVTCPECLPRTLAAALARTPSVVSS